MGRKKTMPEVRACSDAHEKAFYAVRERVIRDLDFEIQIGSILLNATESVSTYLGFSQEQVKTIVERLGKQQEVLKGMRRNLLRASFERDA